MPFMMPNNPVHNRPTTFGVLPNNPAVVPAMHPVGGELPDLFTRPKGLKWAVGGHPNGLCLLFTHPTTGFLFPLEEIISKGR